jgi:hypothetical protein
MKLKPIMAGIGELLCNLLPTGEQVDRAPANFVAQGFLNN